MIEPRLSRLLLIQSIMLVAMSIAGMFSLIYLVAEGFSYQQATFYILSSFGTTIIMCLAMNGRSVNVRISLFFSMLALAGSYASFLYFDGMWLVIMPGIFYGIQIALFWIPYNVILLKLTKKRSRGFAIGITFLLYPLIGVIMPLVGGKLIETLDFAVVFQTALVILLANAIIVLFSRDAFSMRFTPRIDLRVMKGRLNTGFLMQGLHEGIFLLAMPLLSYHFAGGEFKTGILFSIFALTGAVASVLIARVSDRNEKRLLFIRIGAIGGIPGVIIASMATGLDMFVVGMAMGNLFVPMTWIFLLTHTADRNEKKANRTMLTRELLLNIGRAISAVTAIIMLSFWSIEMVYMFSVVYLVGLLVVK